ncbi:MAG: VOC family protein [Dehalococcoidia bacterium]|nr:VOC family protein [Dehalococcoidia bacterium]
MSAPPSVSISRIGQVAHTVRDLDAAVTFFRDTLGLQHLFTAGQLAFFDCGGTRLMVDALPEAQGNGNSVLYFQVDDIAAAAAGLEAKGVELQAQPHRIHTYPDGAEERMAFFPDPEGSMFAFMAQRPPA